MLLNMQLEGMINVPKLAGTFYVRWRVLSDTKLAGKGRTTKYHRQ